MKTYIKPEVECISFVAENVTTITGDTSGEENEIA